MDFEAVNNNNTMEPRVVVIGVGGGGCNAVDNMIDEGVSGVEFLSINTDLQALKNLKCQNKLQIGNVATGGLGAGADPEVGRISAEESIAEVLEFVDGANMVFIAAGMGGGTGTGAAPVIAREIKAKGILTVSVVTKPFEYEGKRKINIAEQGIRELENNVDAIIVIPNHNLFILASSETTFKEGFKMADNVITNGVKSITDLILKPGLINLDFNDIKSVIKDSGRAMMGIGQAEGEQRAIAAVTSAISNPLLDNSSIRGAMSVLVNITSDDKITFNEPDEIAKIIRDEVDEDALINMGVAVDDDCVGKIRVSVIATNLKSDNVSSGSVGASSTSSSSSSVENVSDFAQNFNNFVSSPIEKEKFDEKIIEDIDDLNTKSFQVEEEFKNKEPDNFVQEFETIIDDDVEFENIPKIEDDFIGVDEIDFDDLQKDLEKEIEFVVENEEKEDLSEKQPLDRFDVNKDEKKGFFNSFFKQGSENSNIDTNKNSKTKVDENDDDDDDDDFSIPPFLRKQVN